MGLDLSSYLEAFMVPFESGAEMFAPEMTCGILSHQCGLSCLCV